MPPFPNTAYSQDTQILAEPNVLLDKASDGTIRGRVLNAAEVYEVTLVHNNLTEAQANAIEDFYETDPTQEVNVTWRSVTYNCRWMGKPEIRHFRGATWTAISRLKGVRADSL